VLDLLYAFAPFSEPSFFLYLQPNIRGCSGGYVNMLDAWIYGYYCEVGGRYFSIQSQVSGHVREILTICFKEQGTGLISFDFIFLRVCIFFPYSRLLITLFPRWFLILPISCPCPYPLDTGGSLVVGRDPMR
jgi:hypothetical protein